MTAAQVPPPCIEIAHQDPQRPRQARGAPIRRHTHTELHTPRNNERGGDKLYLHSEKLFRDRERGRLTK